MKPINYSLLLTRAEAADFLGVPVSSIRSWTVKGWLAHYQFGRFYRYSRDDLIAFPRRVEPTTAEPEPETAHFSVEMSGSIAGGA